MIITLYVSNRVMPARREGTILYVTTGVLVQWLQSDPALTNVTHLVLDEIHERDVLCDFLITLLKYIIPKVCKHCIFDKSSILSLKVNY